MKKEFKRALFILSVVVMLALIHLFIYTQNIGLKYKLTALKGQLSEIVSKNRELGAQVAQKENLGEVEKVAAAKLGMVYPAKVTYILPGNKANAAKTSP